MYPSSEKRINKGQVTDVRDLKQYLRQQAKSNKRLYHYTTYESLLEIIKNQSFRLTRLDLLNDKAEKKLGFQDDSFENYVISFTQDKEYVSMWAMYGKASGIKLRVDFDNFFSRKDLHPMVCIYGNDSRIIPVLDHVDLWDMDNPNFVLTDICYIDKHTNAIKHNTKPFDFTASKYDMEEMTGLIKYDAWEFEKETRLKVQLSGNRTLKDYGYPKHIYYRIPTELIKSFHITFNPWMSKSMKDEIKKSLSNIAGFDMSCDDSDDDGEITEL